MFRSVLNKLIVFVAVLVTSVFIYTDGHELNNLHGDGLGYYMYLPSAIIYHNTVHFDDIPPDMLAVDDPIKKALDNKAKNDFRTEKGIVINQYTYGVALMEAPFFLVAHGYEKVRGLKANGYSDTYQIAIKIAGLFYALLGLWLIYKTLRRYYSSTIATITAVVIFMGTNLFWFTAYQSAMSHVPLFFLYALLIWLTIRLHEKPHTARFLAVGLVTGLITIIRPTDIICLLISLLYNVYDKQTFKDKIAFIRKHYKVILLTALAFVIPAIPQMMYWKAVSGHYLFYSYGNQSFNWAKPRIFDGLVGPSNGWLIYSPVMGLALLGLLCFKRNKSWNFCLWLIFPIYVYVIYSWYCYNYINGLGSRPMIHLYPLLAIPMAALFDFISKRSITIKGGVLIATLFFIAINISYSYQQIRGMLNSEESNYVFNWGIMFHNKLTYRDLCQKDIGQFQPDTNKIEKVATLGFQGFEDTVAGHWSQDPSGISKYVYRFNDEEHFDKAIRVTYSKALFKDARFLKGSGRFMCPDFAGYFKHLIVLDIKHNDDHLIWAGCKVENKLGITDSLLKYGHLRLDHQETGKWSYVYFFVKIPKGIQEGDAVELDLWNGGKQPLYMDDFKLEAYR